MNIKKAVFPVGGLGTHFLPATKSSPKEMMPIVDMPLIQYAVNEAIAAGITELIFVTNSSKRAIEDHFDSNMELESNLIATGKYDLLEIVRRILPENITCSYVRQSSPLGVGHAVLCAKHLVGNEAFAVLLADDLIESGKQSCLQEMISVYQEKSSSIIAVQKVLQKDTKNYGVVDVASPGQHIAKILGIIEKPLPEKAPSNLAVMGRYILTPRIFSLLEQTKHGADGEIQLTDAIEKLLHEEPVYSLHFRGKRYDCGNKLGYLEATIAFALKHPELADDFKQCLQETIEDMA